jgi:3D (Asp-Asp-Asp) domain-containing protein
MTRREQIVYKTMSENIARAGEFGLCPGPFVAMRSEYRRVVRREHKHLLLGAVLLVSLIFALIAPWRANAEDKAPVEATNTVLRLEWGADGSTDSDADDIAAEAPDEAERIQEAIKAKSNVIENCTITGYCADCVEKYAHMNQDEFGRVLTASGQWVYPGSCVATDPDVIPTGSTVIIGDKTYIALDVGVRGNHVDILMTHEEAQTAGVRHETVWWCDEQR